MKNVTGRNITYTICLSLKNPFSTASAVNQHQKNEGVSLIRLRSQTLREEAPEFGDLSVATDAEEVSFQEYLYRGAWFDDLAIYWKDLGRSGRFTNRSYPPVERGGEGYGKDDHCVLAAHLQVKPGERRQARFVLSWSFPNCINYWNPECNCEDGTCTPKIWKNYYSTLFCDSL